MIISQIVELKQAGVWKNYSSPPDLHLAPRTLIYGFNGSGKTTLSRVFSSIQRGCLEDRLPPETAFKIKTLDGTIVTQDLVSNPFGNSLLVFNTDFVSRNFEWDASTTKGIAYLSEKKVDARKEYDPDAMEGDELGKKLDTAVLGRIDAQTAKQVIIQKVRDAERGVQGLAEGL